ncbi:cyclic AMP-responsive element-binding protein 3 isoform 1-T2 [Morphnus guianensis]
MNQAHYWIVCLPTATVAFLRVSFHPVALTATLPAALGAQALCTLITTIPSMRIGLCWKARCLTWLKEVLPSTWVRMGLEGTSKALTQEQSSSLPIAVDAGPQLVQSTFQELVLTEEERQLLAKEGVSLPTHKPLNKTQERLLKKVRQKIRNKHAASDSRRRRKMYVDDLESRLAACTAQNQKLEKKVQLLQKQNTSLLKQLQKLRASLRQSKTRTTITTCGMVVVLSLCLVVPRSIRSPGRRERKLEIRVQTQRIRKVPNQVAPDVQEGAVLEELSSQPEEPLTSGSLNPSGEEGQSAPNLDPRSSVNSNSSSDPPMAEGSEPGPSQPQEQHVESSPVQTVVSMMWKNGRQEERQHAATVVIEHHRANGM